MQIKSFSEFSNERVTKLKLEREKAISNERKREASNLQKALEEFGVSKISDLSEEQQQQLFSKLSGRKLNEAEVKSDAEFKEYAFSVLKKAFGDEFDEAKAQDVVDGILDKCGDDYGACVGMLNKSLGS